MGIINEYGRLPNVSHRFGWRLERFIDAIYTNFFSCVVWHMLRNADGPGAYAVDGLFR
jgi:hypothetical protein